MSTRKNESFHFTADDGKKLGFEVDLGVPSYFVKSSKKSSSKCVYKADFFEKDIDF